MNSSAVCGTTACGGDLAGTWKPSIWCGDPAASGRCVDGTPTGSITFAADKSYTALLQLDCPNGTHGLLHGGKGTWSASGFKVTLTPNGSSPFALGYCVSGSSLARRSMDSPIINDPTFRSACINCRRLPDSI